MEIFLFLFLVPAIINGFLFHIISKRDGFVNPIVLTMVFLSFFGTVILFLVLLSDLLDKHYNNK